MSNIPKSKTNEHELKSILERKLNTLFTDSIARSEVAEILSGVGTARLQIAVLKLAENNPTIENHNKKSQTNEKSSFWRFSKESEAN